MRSALWLIIGIGVGFVAAHLANRTDGGRAVFEDLNTRAREFGDGVASGYRSREAELRDTGESTTSAGPDADR